MSEPGTPGKPNEAEERRDEVALDEIESVVAADVDADERSEDEQAREGRLSRFPLLTVALVTFLAFIVGSTLYNFIKARRETGMSEVQYTKDGRKIIYLNLWDVPKPGSPSPTQRAERAVLERFLEKYPWIRIRKTRGIRVEGEARESSFLMAMAGGTAPDVFYHNFRSVRSYMKQGFVLDLTDFIMNDWSQKKRDELLPRKIRPILGEEVKNPDGSVSYHYYAVPKSFDDLHGIYFRKDLFLKAGLPVDGPEAVCRDWGVKWNWDALYKIAQKLTIPEEGQYGFNVQAAFIAGWMWPNYVWQAGGEIVREWVRCPVCNNITPVPKDSDGIPIADPAKWKCRWVKCPKCGAWNPPPEWAGKPWWNLPEIAGDKLPEDAWKCSECGADLHEGERHNTDLRDSKRFWRTAYDELPAIRALEFYRRLRWTWWTRCRSLECQGKNVTFDITYGMLGVTDPLLKDRPVIGRLYGDLTYEDAGILDPRYRDKPIPGMPKTEEEALSHFAVCPVCGLKTRLADLKRRAQLYQGVAYASPRSDDVWRMLSQDRTLAMTIWFTSANYVGSTSFDPDEFGVVGLPEGPTGIRANFLNATLVSINSSVKDPEKQKACWEYIKFLTSDEADEIRVRVSVENGLARFIHPGKLKKYGYEEYLQFVPESWKRVFDELLVNGRPEPYAPDYKSIATQGLAKPIDAVLFQNDQLPRKVLAASAVASNRNVFGVVPPKVMRNRRIIAWVVFAVMVVFLGVMFSLFIRNLRLLIKAQGSVGGATFLRASMFTAWLFMVPAIATILIWQYVPLVRGSVMAFMDYYVLKPSRFVGLDNFITVFTDKVFWVSVLNTFVYTAFIIVIGFGAPIFLALLLSEVPRFKILFRVIFYLPAVTSGLVIMFLWKKFYDPSPAGTFNTILSWFGVGPQKWLQDPRFGVAMLCIVIPGVWAGAGPGSIVYLAALKAVPEEMYEAADIDGAGVWQKIWHITFPFLKPLVLINFVGAFIGAFRATQNIFVMTGGGPGHATLTLSLNIYLKGFLFLKFGQATAIAWIMGSLLIGFTIYQLRILRDVRFTAAANQ